jgi:hypothetical protein
MVWNPLKKLLVQGGVKRGPFRACGGAQPVGQFFFDKKVIPQLGEGSL